MNENRFRGKRLDNGKWYYGSYLFLHVPEHDWTGTSRGPAKDVHFIVDQEDVNYAVDPATLGQYTGEDAENGAIFEGDIVEFFGMRGVVVQEHGAFGISVSGRIDYDLLESKIPCNNDALFCHNDNFISLWELWWNYEQDDNPLYVVKIIGNVYDNPELLRGVHDNSKK